MGAGCTRWVNVVFVALGLSAAGAVLVFGPGCHNAAPASVSVQDSAAAAVAPVYGAAKGPSAAAGAATGSAATGSAATEDSSGEDEIKEFYDECIASYTKLCVIDSAFMLGTDHYRLYVKDSCLMDSAIVLPKRYVSMYKLDSFVTHNFISKVRLEKNGATILDRVITKKDFVFLLDASLQSYATIRCPNLELKSGCVRLGYSVSIPLTDVGQMKYAVIGGEGSITFRDSGADD